MLPAIKILRPVGTLLFFLLSAPLYAQPDSSGAIASAEVVWAGQFPEPGKQNFKGQNIVGRVFSLVTGAEKKGDMPLQKPVSIYATDPQHIWIADQGSGVLFRVEEEKASVPRSFTRQKFVFSSLVGLCPLPGKGMLFTDSRLNGVYLAEEGSRNIQKFTDTTVLQQPTGIAYQPKHEEFWVVETAAHCITVFDKQGRRLRSFGERGAGGGEFNFPTHIWIDREGRAYVTDALNYRVQLFDDRGNFLSSFGEFGNASGYFASPKGLATDSYGNIYVADALFHVVQVFDRKGRFLLSFGSQGRDTAQFWMPAGVYIDAQDNIYVADSYNSRVQWFRLSNIVKR